MPARRRRPAEKPLAISPNPKKKKTKTPVVKAKIRAKAANKADAGKDADVIAEAEELAKRSIDFNDSLTDLCKDLPGTAPGTKITEARLKGAAGKRQRHINKNLNPSLAKMFGGHLIDSKAFRRVGTPNTGSRYITTPGASSFSSAGPMGEELAEYLNSDFIVELLKAFPNHNLRIRVSGAHIFLGDDAKFHAHCDKTKGCSEQAMFLIHIGHRGTWVQNMSGRRNAKKSRVERHHGCVVSMTKDARILEHGLFDLQGIGATLLFTVDGADTETVDRIRRHLAIAVNSFLVMYDAKTAEPAAAITKPDGGPRVLPWEKFERSCVSEIMAFFGQRSWADLSVDEYDWRCDAIAEGMVDSWAALTPEDRGRRGAAQSAGMKKRYTELSPDEREAKRCHSGLLMPKNSACSACGAMLAGAVSVRYQRVGTSLYPIVTTKCGKMLDGCGKVHSLTKLTTRQTMCAKVPQAEFDMFEKKLAAAIIKAGNSPVVNASPIPYTRDEKVLVRLGYGSYGRSWMTIAQMVFAKVFAKRSVNNDSAEFGNFCSRVMRRVKEDARKVLETIKVANIPANILIYGDDDTITVNEEVLMKRTTAKQRKALYDGI